MFIIETKNKEAFGGIMMHNIQLSVNGWDKPLMSFLFTLRPQLRLFGVSNKEALLCEPGVFRYGNGERGNAIAIVRDLKRGWTEKETIFGNVGLLNDDQDGWFEIEKMEVYLMI